MEYLLWARPCAYAFFMGLSFWACAYHFSASFWVGLDNKNIAWQCWYQRFKNATHPQDPHALPSQNHLLHWDTCVCVLFPPLLSILYSINYIFAPHWSLSAPRPTTFLQPMQIRRDPGGRSGNRGVQVELSLFSAWREVFRDHTQATHTANALHTLRTKKSGQRGVCVIPASILCPQCTFSKQGLRMMTIIILIYATMSANPEPEHTLKNPTEVTYNTFYCIYVSLTVLLIY